MNEYKLVCIDVDGTLVNSNKEIPAENIKALKKACESGIAIAIASGRSPWSVKALLDELGISGYGICLNGAYVVDGNIEILRSEIDHDRVRKISEIVNKYDVKAFFSAPTINITNKPIAAENFNSVVNQKEFIVCSNYDKLKHELNKYDNSILKVSILEEDTEKYIKIREEFEKTNLFQVEQSDINYLDINTRGINKFIGVKKLAEHLNLDLSQVICIGDNENDIDMIKNCGLGIAMANSCKKLIDICDTVTLSNDDCGVAQAIYDYVIS